MRTFHSFDGTGARQTIKRKRQRVSPDEPEAIVRLRRECRLSRLVEINCKQPDLLTIRSDQALAPV